MDRVSDRRQALVRLGTAVASLAFSPRLARAQPTAAPAPRPDDLAALATRLRAGSREAAFEVAEEAIRAGATPATLLGAIFIAGVEEIRPQPGGLLHPVLMVESTFELAAAASPRDAWLFTLYNLDEMKISQERERRGRGGDFVMAPAPPRRAGGDAAAAKREFLDAMAAFDAERTEAATISLLPHVDADSFFEILRPIAARCFGFIGHKIIFAVQAEHVLRRIGWAHAEAPLRSLAVAMLPDRRTDTFDRARDLAGSIPAAWLSGKEEPAKSEALLGALRTASVRDAPEVVTAAFRDGLGPATVWDALALFGSELFHRRPGRRGADGGAALLPVHALTVTNAFRHAFLQTKVDDTRRLLVLQSAAWLAALRDDFGGRIELSMKGPGLEALGASAGAGAGATSVDALLERASPDDARVFIDAHPEKAAEYERRLRERLVRRAVESHQVKYAVAMEEEAARVDPRWKSRLLAPAIDYLANPRDEDTDVYARSVATLGRAGVR